MSLSPSGPTSPQDPRGLLILQPRDLARCYLPTTMRLWQRLPLREAPCLSRPLASRDFIHQAGSPQRWPDLKWPRAKDTQSCVEAASVPLGEERGRAPEGTGTKTGQRGWGLGGAVFSRMKSALKSFSLMLSCYVKCEHLPL